MTVRVDQPWDDGSAVEVRTMGAGAGVLRANKDDPAAANCYCVSGCLLRVAGVDLRVLENPVGWLRAQTPSGHEDG